MDSIDSHLLSLFSFILLEIPLSGQSFGIVAGILTILILLIGSAMASGAEEAYFSLGPGQINDLRLKNGKINRVVLQLLDMPRQLIATLIISNYFFNIAIVIISTYLTYRWFDFNRFPYWFAFLVQIMAVTFLILLFGELLPKAYANRHSLKVARISALPVKMAFWLFYPVSRMLISSGSLVDKRINYRTYNMSAHELSDAIELASGKDTPDEEKKMLQGIVKFGDIEVKEIMKSRMDITAIEISADFRQLINVVTESGYSRIPVYDDSIDNIKGILYIKDLLPYFNRVKDFNWTQLIKEPFFVPENKKINDLLQEFQVRKIHMAVVVDEYGGTSGIVTLEDIIEEIVGEISDEHDEPVGEFEYKKLGEHSYIFEGKISLNDLCKILEIEDDIFDDVRGEADTLAGLILELMERMPERGEKVKYRQFSFTVKAADKRRIKRVLVTLMKSASEKDSIK